MARPANKHLLFYNFLNEWCVCIKKFPYNDIIFHVTLEILCAENDLHISLQLSINFVNLIGIYRLQTLRPSHLNYSRLTRTELMFITLKIKFLIFS